MVEKIKFTEVNPVPIEPKRKHDTDAGIDLYSVEEIFIGLNKCAIIRTGFSVEIPDGYFGFITNKSRNDFLIGAGIVDQGYQGELLVKIYNLTAPGGLVIHPYDPIAQLVLVPTIYPEVELVSPLEEKRKTARGTTGGIVTQLGSV